MFSGVCGLLQGEGGRAPTRQGGSLHKGVSEPRQEEEGVHREEESAGGEAEWIANQSISQLSKQIKEMGAGFSLSGKRVGTQGEREKGLQNPCAGGLELKKSA